MKRQKTMAQIQRNEAGGILLLDKPEGITSQTAVNAVRRAFGTKQAGHTGTLDPMATGLLIVLVGRAVKASEYAVCDRKRYEAVLRLGITTDTQDVSGKILSRCDELPGEEKVLAVCKSFTGEIDQVPPMYSALKVGGKKLYELAREGVTVERESRKITIHSLTAERLGGNDYALSVECSSGTYIRTLCDDIGKALGCGGTMAALRRTNVGPFSVNDAVTTDFIKSAAEGNAVEDIEKRLLPLDLLFSSYPEISLSAFHEKLYRSGCAIAKKKLGISESELGSRFRVCDAAGDFFSLGELVEGPEGPALKSLKLFVI